MISYRLVTSLSNKKSLSCSLSFIALGVCGGDWSREGLSEITVGAYSLAYVANLFCSSKLLDFYAADSAVKLLVC